jgi:hypothetical protein
MGKTPKDKKTLARGPDGRFVSTSKANAPNLFLYGLGLLFVCLAWVQLSPDMRPIQVAIFAILLALSAALVASGIGGLLEIKTKTIKAGMSGVAFLLAWASVMATAAPEAFASIASFLGMGRLRK